MNAGPSVHVRAVATWLAVYPLITTVIALSKPLLGNTPLPLQTLVLTVIVVPTAVYVVVPRVLRILTGHRHAAPSGATDSATTDGELK